MFKLLKTLIIWIATILPTHPLINRMRYRVFRFFGAKIGEGTVFCSNVRIKGDVRIGKFCNFNENVLIKSTGKGVIRIGDYTIIAPNVVMRNANHIFESTEKPIRYQGKDIKDIVIGNDVWIASNAVILPGAKIGDGSVIGAGAIVKGIIPPYSVAMGNPAKVIATRRKIHTMAETALEPETAMAGN